MGSGKTTVGRKLANLVGRSFQDLDKFLEEKEGTSVSAIFEKKGEPYFRQIEKEGLRTLALSESPLIISLGGGTLMANENLTFLQQNGYLIYLKLSPAALFSRLRHNASARPLLQGLSDEAMKEKITRLLQEREQQYLQADLVVEGLDLEAVTLKKHLLENRML